MSALGVSIAEVFAALSHSSANARRTVERGSQAFVIKASACSLARRSARRPRRRAHGVPVRLRDVATVSYGFPAARAWCRRQREDAVEGIVLMRRGENPSVVRGAAARRSPP